LSATFIWTCWLLTTSKAASANGRLVTSPCLTVIFPSSPVSRLSQLAVSQYSRVRSIAVTWQPYWAHRVEVLERAEVCGRQVADVLAGGDQGLLDVLPGQAGRVLAADVGGVHGFSP
jgi:hypothetical protein